jgi:hypothetical protein
MASCPSVVSTNPFLLLRSTLRLPLCPDLVYVSEMFLPASLSSPSFPPGSSVSPGQSKLCHRIREELAWSTTTRLPLSRRTAAPAAGEGPSPPAGTLDHQGCSHPP